MEAALLRELNWEVVMLTPSHFVDAFLGISGGATFPSDTIGGQPWAEVAAEYLEKYTIFFSVQVGRARAPLPRRPLAPRRALPEALTDAAPRLPPRSAWWTWTSCAPTPGRPPWSPPP